MPKRAKLKMPTATEIRAELRGMRDRLFERLVQLQPSEGQEGPAEEQSLRKAIWAAAHTLTWLKLEEDMSRPEAECRELMVFEQTEDGTLVLQEV
jgi:hypothetical protein